MLLSGLLVLHRHKSSQNSAAPVLSPSTPPTFHLQTCLRELWIIHDSAAGARPAVRDDMERYQGSRAYEFLLRIGCGLDSEIKGESDIFGQLRDAWRDFEKQQHAPVGDLGPLMQRIFEDVKEIRSSHLRALSTTTYGGLTRRLLGDDARAPTLLIGAGHMARAVLPYLAGEPLYVWNRSEARLAQLLSATGRATDKAKIRVLASDAAAELDAWRQATNVIVCIPADAQADDARIAAWRSRDRTHGRIIHLGLLGAPESPWNQVPRVATLTDLFGLQATHTAQREAQLARAALACREKANLRSLGGPLSLAHGWEDLSLFASAG